MGIINYQDPSLLATSSANGVMSESDKAKLNSINLDGYAAWLTTQFYKSCQYVATTAVSSLATLSVALDLAGNTLVSGDRALCPYAGTICGIYVYSGSSWAADPNFSVIEGAKVTVTTTSAGPVEYWQTAATGSGTAVFGPVTNANRGIPGNFWTAASVADTAGLATSTVVLTATFVQSGAPSDSAHIVTNFPAVAARYLCQIGVRVAIWETINTLIAGTLETMIDAVLTTNSAGVVTGVTLQSTPIPTRVPDASALTTASCTAAGSSSNTLTVSATQPSGIGCSARAKLWIINYEQLSQPSEAVKAASLTVSGAAVIAPLLTTATNYGTGGGAFTMTGGAAVSSGLTTDGISGVAYYVTGTHSEFTLTFKARFSATGVLSGVTAQGISSAIAGTIVK